MKYLHAVIIMTAITALPVAAPAATAVFAGGCFWCVESDFEKLKGVSDVVSGYAGGMLKNPTYEAVSAGASGHIEVARVHYDPAVISYEQLLAYFWRHHDFLDGSGQFCDRGEQYSPAIFVASPEQAVAARRSLASIQKRFKEPVATRILPLTTFYPAETYHQDYYKKNSYRYSYYRFSCGRDARMTDLVKRLTP